MWAELRTDSHQVAGLKARGERLLLAEALGTAQGVARALRDPVGRAEHARHARAHARHARGAARRKCRHRAWKSGPSHQSHRYPCINHNKFLGLVSSSAALMRWAHPARLARSHGRSTAVRVHPRRAVRTFIQTRLRCAACATVKKVCVPSQQSARDQGCVACGLHRNTAASSTRQRLYAGATAPK